MQLLVPDISLMVWIIFSLFSLGLIVLAMISLLRNTTMDNTLKLVWSLTIIFIPLMGAILFFTIGKQKIKT